MVIILKTSKTQVFQVIGQASSADLGQQVVPKVEVLEGVGQVVGVQVRDEVACQGELADPVVGKRVAKKWDFESFIMKNLLKRK